MKRFISSITALLLASLLLVGCSAEVESSQIESVEESSRVESVEESSRAESVESSEIIAEESSTPEAESSLEDKFAGIASFDTEFNEDKVIYYDEYMVYQVTNFLYPEGLNEEHSKSRTFPAYQNASDDDWFVVALSCKDDVIEVAEHIGAIEIEDHPFSNLYDWYIEEKDMPSSDERKALYAERYALLFPGAKYEKDPNPRVYIPYYNYVGYFTKPMLEEMYYTYFDTYIAYTLMPEIGNNECWFKNLRK